MGLFLASFLVMLGVIAAVHAAPIILGMLALALHGLGLIIVCLLVAGVAWSAKKAIWRDE